MAALALAAALAAAPGEISLLLVTVDTLRADRLRCYGYEQIETPATDRLAREGVVALDATAHVPLTRPSHASLLSGRLPYEHGIRDNFSAPLDRGVPTLATLLAGRGYDTAAFIGAYPLAAMSGLGRGFAVYDDPFSAAEGGSALLDRAERRGDEVVDAALAWLERPRSRPFFAWVHLFDPHAPYRPPPPFAARYAGRLYDGEVAYADAQVGRLLDALDARGLRERTLVVFTSDHGEGLGDHGEDEHMMFVYDSTLRVPLIFSLPGVLPAGRRVSGQFRSVDLAATVLDLLGAPPVATSGASRAAVLRDGGRIPDNESYAESLYGSLHFGYAPLRALRAEGWKYVDAPRPEIYDLRDDPAEERNLLDLRPQVARRMSEHLQRYDSARAAPSAPVLAGDPGALEQLMALGYVGGGAAPGDADAGADPKDRIAEYQSRRRDVQAALEAYRDGDLDRALPLLDRLARGDTVSFDVEYFRGKALLRKERYGPAAEALERAVDLAPFFGPAYVDLVRALAGGGRLEEADATLLRALDLEPRNAALHAERAVLARQRGDLSGARASLRRARALDPRDARYRTALSSVYREMGDAEAALAEAREAVRIAPDASEAWVALGVLLGARGEETRAVEAFQQAHERAPDDDEALFYLGATLLRSGRAEEALPLLTALVDRSPDHPSGGAALEAARRLTAPLPSGAARLRLIQVATRSEARALRALVSSGESFAALARSASQHSSAAIGGELGIVRIDELAEPLRAAAAALEPGDVSPVLETPGGFVLLERTR